MSGEWIADIRGTLTGWAAQHGATIEGGIVESGSAYLRIRYNPPADDPRDFTIRVSVHRGRHAKAKIKIHPWDEALRLMEAEREITRRAKLVNM